MDNKSPEVGQRVIFHDAKGNARDALILIVWDPKSHGDMLGCINLVIVSDDENKQDQYGRQIERESSVVHKSNSNVHGNYWRYENEKPIPYSAPSKK